jgi:outer membrane usher protein
MRKLMLGMLMQKWHWSRERCRAATLCGLLLAGVVDRLAIGQNGMPFAFQNSQLEVHMNDQNLHLTAEVLISTDGRVLVQEEDLADWRLRAAGAPVLTHQDKRYILLDNLSPVTYRVDVATQSLQIHAPTQNLLSSDFSAHLSGAMSPHMPAAGGFLNYDVSTQITENRETAGAQLDMGFFSRGAVFNTQMLNRDLNAGGSFIRLESTLTMDHPEQLASLRLGDAISRGGAWGLPVRFAGMQWSSNFSTQPDFVTFPIPSLKGSATVPSTAEVYINNVLAYQHDIQAGPFSISELPVVTGQGEVRMVVRDLLGREQVIVQQFYGARRLLRSGLDDFSYEVGAARMNFAATSNDYGPWLMAGTARHGFSESFTGELHGELGADHQAAGLAGTQLMQDVGVVEAAIAASHSDVGVGALLALGFERQTPLVSFGLRTQQTTEHFDQLGLATGVVVPLRQTTAHVGWSSAPYGSVGMAYIQRDNRNQPDNQIVSLNFSRTLAMEWVLGLYAFKSLKGVQDYACGMVLTHALGSRTTASVNVVQRNGTGSTDFQLQQNLPAGSGVGYRLLAGVESSERLDGTVTLQNDYGTYAFEAARFQSVDAYRASASGALAVLGGRVFLARQLGDSFAVVRVPGYPDVQVYAENQPVARTDSKGLALVPGLRPYQNNRIAIEQADLPLDARVDALEVTAVPYFRSGYDLVFPIEKSNGALIRIVMSDGRPIPPGAQVHIVHRVDVFPVAMDGQVYLSGLKRLNQIEVAWDNSHCELQVPYTDMDSPLPHLGSFLCKEIVP